MNEDDFEGSEILEKLAVIGAVDDFFDAIDEDDTEAAARLMRAAGIDARTLEQVLRKIADGGGEH